ncbi:MAG: hypothetical protein MUE40_11685 [Anaerolineae bacterium]|nr:hypothetical protein [Anaerolineae bacterium]
MPERDLEHLTPAVIRERRYAGRWTLYTLHNAERPNIDAYINDALHGLADLPAGQTLYMLHDLSSPQVALTPYFRARLGEVADYLKAHHITGYSAVVLPDTLMNRIFAIFAGSFSRRAGVEQRLFTRYDEAATWMERVLQSHSAGV